MILSLSDSSGHVRAYDRHPGSSRGRGRGTRIPRAQHVRRQRHSVMRSGGGDRGPGHVLLSRAIHSPRQQHSASSSQLHQAS